MQVFNDLVKDIPSHNTISFLHSSFRKYGVNIVYDKDKNSDKDNPVYARLMFRSFSRACKFDYPGVVLSRKADTHIYHVISVPPPPPVIHYNPRFLRENYVPGMDIIMANDGTTVTLYYFDGKWVISTHRGFEVNNYKWVAYKTYLDILDEVLSKYPDFNYHRLDKTKCYSFGFNHSDFHPFVENAQSYNSPIAEYQNQYTARAWFIQSVDLNKFNASDTGYISYTDDIGLPLQENMSVLSLRKLFSVANNSYNNYVNTGVVNYGYLIRIGLKQYLVESTLLKNIRYIFYNKLNTLDKVFCKRKYNIINAFLDCRKHDIFKKLFPQYIPEFVRIDKKIHDIINAIMRIMDASNECKTVGGDNTLDIIANILYTKLLKTLDVHNKTRPDVYSLIYMYMCDKKHTEIIYQLMYL
jgi:hypothetical protein